MTNSVPNSGRDSTRPPGPATDRYRDLQAPRRMRDAQVRRVPVVNDMGRLVAAISIDGLVLVAQNVGAGADAASVVGFHAVGRVGRGGDEAFGSPSRFRDGVDHLFVAALVACGVRGSIPRRGRDRSPDSDRATPRTRGKLQTTGRNARSARVPMWRRPDAPNGPVVTVGRSRKAPAASKRCGRRTTSDPRRRDRKWRSYTPARSNPGRSSRTTTSLSGSTSRSSPARCQSKSTTLPTGSPASRRCVDPSRTRRRARGWPEPGCSRLRARSAPRSTPHRPS